MFQISNFFTKDRMYAFLIHLFLSLVIFIVLLYFILVEWYPEPLFSTDGGWQGIRLIAFVDIVLGPFLTLMVFKKGKPGLKFDLSVIAMIQFAALVSGTLVVHGERPVALIMLDGRLTPVIANKFKDVGIELSSLGQYSDLEMPMIVVDVPDDYSEVQRLSKKAADAGHGLRLSKELFRKLTSEYKVQLRQKSLDVAKFVKDEPGKLVVYQQFIKENKYKNQTLIYFALYSRYEYGIAVLDSETFELLDILHIFPPDLTVQF